MDFKDEIVDSFRNGNSRQGDFLKAIKDDVIQVMKMGISVPKQVALLEKKYEVEMNLKTYRVWLTRHKEELLNKGERKSEEKSIKNPPQDNTKNGSSEDPEKESDGEVEVSEKDTSNDSEKSAKVVIPEREHHRKLDDDVDLSDFND